MTENRPKYSYSQISDRCEPGVSCPQTQATVFHIKQQITWREVRGESAHCVQLSTDVNTNSFQDLCSLENTRRVHVTVWVTNRKMLWTSMKVSAFRMWRFFQLWPQTDWTTSLQDGPSWTQNPFITLTRWACRRLQFLLIKTGSFIRSSCTCFGTCVISA